MFLARRSDADGWVVKPLDAFSLRKVATAIMAGARRGRRERDLVGEPDPA